MVGYTEPFWHTFNLDFEKSNEERDDAHNKSRQSLYQLDLIRKAKLQQEEDCKET